MDVCSIDSKRRIILHGHTFEPDKQKINVKFYRFIHLKSVRDIVNLFIGLYYSTTRYFERINICAFVSMHMYVCIK